MEDFNTKDSYKKKSYIEKIKNLEIEVLKFLEKIKKLQDEIVELQDMVIKTQDEIMKCMKKELLNK